MSMYSHGRKKYRKDTRRTNDKSLGLYDNSFGLVLYSSLAVELGHKLA